ncbi:hypothetical protein [Dactylosporangium sp. CA-092794]|uniref:hypothetical protein n=1 Tax=Dactylosporangium sp. CA-092794 TaxID=3239929 RepID=UPI003D8BAABD
MTQPAQPQPQPQPPDEVGLYRPAPPGPYAVQAQPHPQPAPAVPAPAQPVVPQQRQAQPHTTTEVRPAVAQPQFDLESSLSRTSAPSLPWQAAQAAAATIAPAEPATTDRSLWQEGPGGPPTEAVALAGAARTGRRLPAFDLPRLRVEWHEVSAAALKHVRGGTGTTGLMLGVDYQRQPVPIRFFRPEPTRVTLVGGLWAQRILVFRALALGARVIVMTGDPRPWQGLGEWATGMNDRLVLWNDPRPPSAPASARQPLLIVTDVSQVGFGARPELRPWQTQVTVVRRLGAEHAHTLQGCNLVMLQQLSRPEAAVAGSALNLTESGAGLLQEMSPDMLALMGSGANRYVWLSPTTVERQYHGPPQR